MLNWEDFCEALSRYWELKWVLRRQEHLKRKKETNHETDKGYRPLLQSVSALRVLYFPSANERVAISFIAFVNTQHEKTLMKQ